MPITNTNLGFILKRNLDYITVEKTGIRTITVEVFYIKTNKIFTSKDGKEYVIDTAIQTISFSLDEKGGKIKSEAATDVKTTAMPNMNEPRYFNIDNTFALFLKEESKGKPYFAARIENIKKYQ